MSEIYFSRFATYFRICLIFDLNIKKNQPRSHENGFLYRFSSISTKFRPEPPLPGPFETIFIFLGFWGYHILIHFLISIWVSHRMTQIWISRGLTQIWVSRRMTQICVSRRITQICDSQGLTQIWVSWGLYVSQPRGWHRCEPVKG